MCERVSLTGYMWWDRANTSHHITSHHITSHPITWAKASSAFRFSSLTVRSLLCSSSCVDRISFSNPLQRSISAVAVGGGEGGGKRGGWGGKGGGKVGGG